MNELELTTREPQAVALRQEENPALHMLQQMIEKGVTSDNAAAFESVVKLCEHMEDRAAQRAFNAAYCAMQKEMPHIEATKAVPLKNGGVKYKYAPYEEIESIAGPIIRKHGFSTRFNARAGDGTQTCICTLVHEAGHAVPNEFTVHVGDGPYDATAAQADSAAATTAQREAYCDALGIVRRPDHDARREGKPITADQASDLRTRSLHLGWPANGYETKFLKWLKAETFEEIQTSRYAEAVKAVEEKEAAKIAAMRK